MEIKELRQSKGLSQRQAAELMGLPFRTYQNYEYGLSKSSSFVGRMIIRFLTDYQPYTPEKGLLPLAVLKETVQTVLKAYSKEAGLLTPSFLAPTPKERRVSARMSICSSLEVSRGWRFSLCRVN
jgi:transcriptional regulator with XRE-family HTH domain